MQSLSMNVESGMAGGREWSGMGAKLGAVVWFLFGLLLILIAIQWSLESTSGGLPSLALRLGGGFCVVGCFCGVMAYGWWMRRLWGRRLSLVFLWPVTLGGVGFLAAGQLSQQAWIREGASMAFGILAVPGALGVWYLHRRATREMFRNRQRPRLRYSLAGLLGFVALVAVSLSLVRSLNVDSAYYRAMAMRRAKAGDLEGAARMVARLRNPASRRYFWDKIVSDVARAGDAPGVMKVVRQQGQNISDGTWRYLAGWFLSNGSPAELEQFLEVLGKVRGPELEASVREDVKASAARRPRQIRVFGKEARGPTGN